ncbi:conserved hypothetical protein [Ricinus communis]|uniref:Uncharacterized protein n=1 Tax=Ricinus communis TaxID=3988 RepID=B9RTS6_RICCO|nr:conserved hypothetical protein [Ricinus communis]
MEQCAGNWVEGQYIAAVGRSSSGAAGYSVARQVNTICNPVLLEAMLFGKKGCQLKRYPFRQLYMTMLHSFASVSFVYVPRCYNWAANLLAKKALISSAEGRQKVPVVRSTDEIKETLESLNAINISEILAVDALWSP